MEKTEGYLFLCFGVSYINDCLDIYETLRKNNDFRPIDIVTLPKDFEYAKSLNIFNNIICYDIEKDQKFNLCNTSFEKYCLLPRLRLNKFLNYHYTLILDVDILCAFSTEKVWDFLKKQNQGLSMIGSINNPIWHWGFWDKICNFLKIECFETHGGLFFFNKDYKNDFEKILKYAEECFDCYDFFGMKRFYQNGKVDEPCFAYAFNKLNYKPINFSDFPIMTFNLSESDEIPTKKMTEQMQYTVMDDYIPYIHMFSKNKSYSFKEIKNKILYGKH
jgi:hypothetical protein